MNVLVCSAELQQGVKEAERGPLNAICKLKCHMAVHVHLALSLAHCVVATSCLELQGWH